MATRYFKARYFKAIWKDGVVAVRSSATRVYVKASRYGSNSWNVSFHKTMAAAPPTGTTEEAPCVEITRQEYRTILDERAIADGKKFQAS